MRVKLSPITDNKASTILNIENSPEFQEIANTFVLYVNRIIGDHFNLDNIEKTMDTLAKALIKKASNQFIQEKDPKHMKCPECDKPMKVKEKLPRKIKGIVDYDYKRRSFYCSECNIYNKPLDSLLQCRGSYSLEIKEAILLLGQRIPFEESSLYLQKLLKVNVSNESIRKCVESVGQRIADQEWQRVEQRTDQQATIRTNTTESVKQTLIEDTAYLQMDGCMVQTRELQWKEVKNGLLFRKSDISAVNKHRNQIIRKKYFSVFKNGESSLEAFKRRASQEAYDFNFHCYKTQVIVGDGAPWIWEYASYAHPDAIQILDYYHASEYLSAAIKSMDIKGEKDHKKLRKKLLDLLWKGKIKQIIVFLQKSTQNKEVTDCIRYYENNKQRMKYGEYRKMNLEIGSGAIESAHRIIIHTRMKQSGMHWGKDNVQSIASLRAKFLSGEWNDVVENYLKEPA